MKSLNYQQMIVEISLQVFWLASIFRVTFPFLSLETVAKILYNNREKAPSLPNKNLLDFN